MKLILGWVGYLIMYFLTENLIPFDRCHVIHSKVDDLIPFNEYFIIFYYLWYVLLVGSLLYFFLYDIESFRHLQIYIIVTQVIAMVVYVAYPSIQLGRPDLATYPHHNFCTWLVGIIYSADTPTGVCPSLHVGYSLGIASTWLKKKDAPVWTKILVVFLVIMICLSVMFVKQHSFVDVVAALPMCVIAEIIAFHRWYRQKLSQKAEKS